MRIAHSAEHLTLKDSPGLHWLLGGFFIALGALFVAAPLGLAGDAASMSAAMRALAIGLGGCGIGAGLYVLARSPYSIVVFDRGRREVVVTRYGISGVIVDRCRVGDIAAAGVEEGRDSDGDPIFRPVLSLHSRREVRLSLVWGHDRAAQDAAADAVRTWLAHEARGRA